MIAMASPVAPVDPASKRTPDEDAVLDSWLAALTVDEFERLLRFLAPAPDHVGAALRWGPAHGHEARA